MTIEVLRSFVAAVYWEQFVKNLFLYNVIALLLFLTAVIRGMISFVLNDLSYKKQFVTHRFATFTTTLLRFWWGRGCFVFNIATIWKYQLIGDNAWILLFLNWMSFYCSAFCIVTSFVVQFASTLLATYPIPLLLANSNNNTSKIWQVIIWVHLC